MNARLLFLLAPSSDCAWSRSAALAQVPAPPVTQTSPGVPAGPRPQEIRDRPSRQRAEA